MCNRVGVDVGVGGKGEGEEGGRVEGDERRRESGRDRWRNALDLSFFFILTILWNVCNRVGVGIGVGGGRVGEDERRRRERGWPPAGGGAGTIIDDEPDGCLFCS